MPDKTCKLIEFVGVSEEWVHQASGMRSRGRGLKGLDWFAVTEVPGLAMEGQVNEFRLLRGSGMRRRVRTR